MEVIEQAMAVVMPEEEAGTEGLGVFADEVHTVREGEVARVAWVGAAVTATTPRCHT